MVERIERGKRTKLACAFVLLFSAVSAGAGVACSSGSDSVGGPGSVAQTSGDDASVGTGTGVTVGGDDAGTAALACAPNGDAVRTAPFDFVAGDAGDAGGGGCTNAQIDALEAACYPGSDTACSAFFSDPANNVCNDCVYGPVSVTDPNLLPPIYNWTLPDGGVGALTYVNVGGCIAAYAPGESACAEAEALASGCESDQCTSCALQASATDAVYNAEYAALSGCFGDAAASACSSLESTVQMCTQRLDTGSADAGAGSGVASCFHLVDDSGFFTPAVWSYLKLVCGGSAGANGDAGVPISDAGADQ